MMSDKQKKAIIFDLLTMADQKINDAKCDRNIIKAMYYDYTVTSCNHNLSERYKKRLLNEGFQVDKKPPYMEYMMSPYYEIKWEYK